MKDRLALFLKSEGLTAVKFAEIMEVQPSSISHLLSGRNKPNFEFISRMLLRFSELNPDWIINGNGEIHRSNTDVPSSIITGVMSSDVTDVINLDPLGDMDLFTPKSEVVNDNKPNGYTVIDPIGNVITDVNSVVLPKDEPEAVTVKDRSGKSIERVILFYTDGSFEEYHNA